MTLTYRWWHPPAVALIAAGLARLVPEPWRSGLTTAAAVFTCLIAVLIIMKARGLLREAEQIRQDAIALRLAAVRLIPPGPRH